MCDCGTLMVSARPSAGNGPPVASKPKADRARTLGASQTWIDIHAHPGRCFLGGMATDDPLLGLLGANTVGQSFRELKEGGVAVAAFATVADLRVLGANAEGGLCAVRDFTPGEARADHDRQLDALVSFAGEPGRLLVRRASDIDQAKTESQTGVILTCEGGDFLEGRLEGLGDAHGRGARSVTIVHYRVNEIGDIQTEPAVHGGLTPFGREVIREMNRLGMIVDLAHATFDVTKDVLAHSKHPTVISHSHLASGAGAHARLLSEEHARAVTSGGGLIGAWPAGVAASTFSEYIDEIERLIDVVGIDHVAIGTDMDANYQPVVENYEQVPEIAESLLERGHPPDDVGKVMGLNFLRLFREICG